MFLLHKGCACVRVSICSRVFESIGILCFEQSVLCVLFVCNMYTCMYICTSVCMFACVYFDLTHVVCVGFWNFYFLGLFAVFRFVHVCVC
jgi:hypothetical protein